MRYSIKKDGRSGIRGYSLIELAVVMVVAGILLASFTSAYNLYLQQQIRIKTELNASLITSALSNYLIQKGRYPCPARMDALRTDADYGMETECNPVMNCDDVALTCSDNPNYPTYTVGTCPTSGGATAGQGLCFERSQAYITINNYLYLKFSGGIGCYQGNGNASKSKGWCPGASGTGTVPPKITMQPPVRRGIVPFRTLALPEDIAFDGYTNRFQYAVSENQAVTEGYEPNKGGVWVLNSQGQPYFNVTVDTPYMRPDGIVGSPTGFNNTTASVNETTAAPAAGTTTAASSGAVWATPGAANSVIEYSFSNPTNAWPSGTATLSFTAAKVTTAGALSSGGSQIKPKIWIKENGTALTGYNGVSTCMNGNFAAVGNTWATFTCTFDAAAVTSWNDITVALGNDAQVTSPSPGRNIAFGWVEIQAPKPLVGFTDYFLFSSGKDMAGAYTRAGMLGKPCPTGTLDATNCAAKTTASYRMAEYNDAYVGNAAVCNTTNCHYDDYVKFFSSTETPLWRVSGTGAHIRDLLNVETTGGKIAIATTPDPLVSAVLQVGGEVRAGSSNALMTNACDYGHTNCFNVGSLADPVAQAANFTCPPATPYAVGFESGKIKCSATQTIKCNTGEIATGVNPDGSLQCTGAVTCPSTTVNTCYLPSTGVQETTVLPAGVEGQSYTTPSSGFNYTQNWTCGPNPWWTMQSDTGICDCTPVDETYDVPCNTRWSGNWTGNITVHHVHACSPTETDDVQETANTCVCTDTTETYDDYAGCGPGFTGSITYTRTWDCTSGTAGAWSAAVQTGTNCTCQPQADETRDLCPQVVPWTGNTPEIRSYTCPAGTWSAWAANGANTCACDGAATQTQDLGCAAGETGNHPQQRTYDCVAGTWNAWTDVATATPCTCAPTTETYTSTDCGQTGWSGVIQQHRDYVCPAGTWTSWVTDSSTCSCTGATETRQVACTSPLAGTKDQRRDYDCPNNTWGAWYDTALNCYANTYSWTPKTAAAGPYGSQLETHAGDSCSSLGDKKPCSAQAPDGMGYYHYATCRCE
jgi:prepilin-type N-terminal cleavage/methylation domain-containing protein